jgi:PAS domain S-box-containing protein
LIIDDVFGKPALMLRVEQPRLIYRKGQETIAYIILTTLGVGVVIAALAMLLLSRIVLSRLSSLDVSVNRISSSDDLSARVPVVGKDELSNLSRAVNRMLASLELSRHKLHESESRYHAVVEDQSELICRFRPDGSIAFTNEACRRYFGTGDRPRPGQNFLQSLPPAARGGVDGLLRSLTEKDPAGVQECRYDMEGNTRWLQWDFRAIFDRRGQVAEFQAVGRDITELKRNEEQIKASLKEKDALLKEIHHRVKNNLQIISSILSLQEAKVDDTASREILRDSRDRIKSMALIHEKLYGSSNLSSIDFSEYIASLLSHLSCSYGGNSGRIAARTDLESLSLNIDIAIPLGLMVNEIVTNSFKHAFPGEAQGEIFAELHKVKDGKYLLTVGDNGVGMPADFDIERTSSLGLQLVQALSQQIDSEITIEHAKGTVFKITFAT